MLLIKSTDNIHDINNITNSIVYVVEYNYEK